MLFQKKECVGLDFHESTEFVYSLYTIQQKVLPMGIIDIIILLVGMDI